MRKRIIRWTALLLAALCLAGTAGSALAKETDIFTFLGPEYRAFADAFEQDTPVAVGFRADTMAGGCSSYVWDEASIRYVLDALSAITVGQENATYATDSDYFFFFLMEDGRSLSFCFNQHYLTRDGRRYDITGSDTLWRITFPCYGGYRSLFDVCMDQRVADFVANYDENPPVSVSFRQGNGDVSTSTDPAFIRQVKEAMESTDAVWVEDETFFYPEDEVKSEFVFTMPDGDTLSFTLYGDSIAVEPPVKGLGTQYYALDNMEALWALPFAGYEQIRVEKGIANDLLPLYGEAVETAFQWENREKMTGLTVTRTRNGETVEKFTFTNDPFDAASELAQAFSGLGYIEAAEEVPENGDVCTFTFTDASGKAYVFTFQGDCAVVDNGDGTKSYYPVEHSSIDENGVMDLVYEEQSLLKWKEEVNFQGKGSGKTDVWTVVRTAGILLAIAGAVAGAVFGVITLVRRSKKKKQANGTEAK